VRFAGETNAYDAVGNLFVVFPSGTVISITPAQSSTSTQNAPAVVGTSSSQALAANSNRKRLILQNVGTTNLYILYGTGTAGPVNFTRILPAGGTALDGSSPVLVDDMWQGAVQWASSASGGEGVANELT